MPPDSEPLPDSLMHVAQVRRSEAGDAQGKAPQKADLQRALLSLVEDRHRARVGLRPLPASTAPPPPASK